ncbi:MAG: flagellar biosynthesis protein FlhA [Gammaproteobacteria bacterium]|uniref:flagellar biosynthesis protein FlhA n=1 Tax=Limnobacter sp. TaxID=2003368 RepID=UPI001DB4EDC9|nr:flagellar biosynthesis protein FlhA [Limnobacter sp.]MBU0785079.1 flagellar biosynthesis protein FlhA [Gammaproteobacteria bacterium]MBU0849117.1 flagellar biosynthesis protein FlhA [Gammaproteobacteria bacterium]MBU1781454.1 flagellar biosynthesis protein FlhA [Gammaproteobacteria bacterium]MBU2086834.1 flagellar biosynthesis protein FlhA [Gammaproteobacteria bacterium]MBU2129811.1 flagellar biosynthesis protein FlhA [Gammaproteobacteria bacterium]
MIKAINSFARLASDRSEIVGASLVLLMVVMMVIPIPPQMLDVLIALNITVTVVLVLSAVLLETPLKFSSFPALLLLVTLFRLSLTISTTRQILLEADAGEIITTFGEFVVGGNIAVGLVIFLIISIVNFLVVTKGSERVAEVAARFSLDAMPGKQMSIDGDLRNGSITQDEAKLKRAELQKESQLFGAMDGAIKFVKNDAIAGLVITAVNLLGGLAVGMMQLGMSFSMAGTTYTILSVGDGLVGIIPSLLTSIAAGLIVTRVTKSDPDGSSTAKDVINDLGNNKKAIKISSCFCFIFSAVPGMPTVAFLVAGLVLFYLGFRSEPVAKVKVAQNKKEKFDALLKDKNKSAIQDLTKVSSFDELEVRYPAGMEPNELNLLFSIVKLTRNQLVEDTGFVYPTFKFHEDQKVSDIQIRIYGVPMLSLSMSDKDLQIWCSKENFDKVEDIVELQFNHTLGRYTYLSNPINKVRLDQLGIEYITYEKRWAEMIEALLVNSSKKLFSMKESFNYFKASSMEFGDQVKELERSLPAMKVVEVLQRLLTERVSLRNIRSILGALIDWGQRERDVIIITEQVRKELSDQICFQHAEQGKLKVLSLDPEIEMFIRESVRSDGSVTFLDVDGETSAKLIEIVQSHYINYAGLERLPAIICSVDCRAHFFDLVCDRLRAVQVFSYQEISSSQEIEHLGVIKLDEFRQTETQPK